jgi:hypothetical protein
MVSQGVPYALTEAGALAIRITELEAMLRYFHRASMDLHHYVRGIDRRPNDAEWVLIREQISEMVDPYGPRSPNS